MTNKLLKQFIVAAKLKECLQKKLQVANLKEIQKWKSIFEKKIEKSEHMTAMLISRFQLLFE